MYNRGRVRLLTRLMWNLLQWLNDYVSHSASISARWKSEHTTHEYWIELAKRRDQFIKRTNFHTEFSYASIPDELLTLDEDHKQQIKEKFDFYTENFFPSTIWFLTKILADYERSEDLDNPIAKAVLQLREFVNQLFREHYPQEYNQVEAELAKARKGIKEKAKIKCVECGSSEIVSSGLNYVCKSCGRSFRKKTRRKHYRKVTG